MDIQKYITLKDSTVNYSFEQSYKSVNGILYLFSIIGNVASIVFAYFFLYNILAGVTDDFFGKAIVVALITIISLTAFELLKRFLFKQTAVTILTNKHRYEKNAIGTLAILIICTSFYLSLNGAKTLSDKNKDITTQTTQNINLKVNAISKEYDSRVAKLDKQIDFYNNMIATGTRSVRLRTQYNNLLISTTKQIENINLQKSKAISTAKAELHSTANELKEYSNSNVRAFIVISTFIELIILIGVGFDAYYQHRVFIDFDSLVQNNSKFKKFILYTKLLETVFNNGNISKNDILLTACQLKRLAKAKDLTISDAGARDFFNLLRFIKVADKHTQTKHVALLNMVEAKGALKNYYKI